MLLADCFQERSHLNSTSSCFFLRHSNRSFAMKRSISRTYCCCCFCFCFFCSKALAYASNVISIVALHLQCKMHDQRHSIADEMSATLNPSVHCPHLCCNRIPLRNGAFNEAPPPPAKPPSCAISAQPQHAFRRAYARPCTKRCRSDAHDMLSFIAGILASVKTHSRSECPS